MISPSNQFHASLHKHQWEVFSSPARFRVLVAGRRFGKTELALVEMVNAALQGPGRVVWYLAPNSQQARTIAWDRLKRMTQRFWAKRPSETKMRIELQSGSVLVVNGAYYPDSLRGVGVDFLVVDESALLDPRAWAEVLRPALADRKGRVLFISTPKGQDHFYELYEQATSGIPDWAGFQFSTAQGGVVDQTELESAARDLDADTFEQEFGGKFVNTVHHRVYKNFDRAIHVTPLSFEPSLPVVWSLDFNVDYMSMLIMQRVGEIVHVLSEIVIKQDANTESACETFLTFIDGYYNQLPRWCRPLTINVYGDASGSQRSTAGKQTDWAIVKQAFTKHVGTLIPKYFLAAANPPVRDRVNCVKGRLLNQADEVRLLIDPKCKELIRDLEEVSWAVNAAGKNELNKSDKARTHSSDALGYYIHREFPMRPKIGENGAGPVLSF